MSKVKKHQRDVFDKYSNKMTSHLHVTLTAIKTKSVVVLAFWGVKKKELFSVFRVKIVTWIGKDGKRKGYIHYSSTTEVYMYVNVSAYGYVR